MRLLAFVLFFAALTVTLPASAQAEFPVSDPAVVVDVRDVERFDTFDYNGDGTVRLSAIGRKYVARHRKAVLQLRTKFTPQTGTATVLTTRVPLRS